MATKPNVDDLREVGDVQLTYKWNLIFQTLPNKLSGIDSQTLNTRCTTTDYPKAPADNPSVTVRGATANYNGNQRLAGSITLNFFEDVKATIRKFINDWRKACRDPITGVQSKKSDIECTITLETLDNEDNPNWTIKLTGCIYKDSSIGNLEAGSSSGVMNPSLTIDYDYFVENDGNGN